MVLSNIQDMGLKAALAEQGGEGSPMNVLVKMHSQSASSASEAAATANALIRRVADELNVTPKFQYRKLDNTLHVLAPKDFVRVLIEQPEVLSATSAPTYDSAFIAPVSQRPVTLEDIDRPIASGRRFVSRASSTRKPR